MAEENNIKTFLKGGLFDVNILLENRKVIILIVALSLISAYSSHSLDTKIYQLAKVQKEVRELKSEFVSVRTQLMNLRMGSYLQQNVKERGLEASTVPPHVILVKKDN